MLSQLQPHVGARLTPFEPTTNVGFWKGQVVPPVVPARRILSTLERKEPTGTRFS